MKRKDVIAILSNDTLDEKSKVGKLLQLHHVEITSVKNGLEEQLDANAVVLEALKAKQSEEYVTIKKDYDEFKLTTTVKESKLKNRLLDIVKHI